MRNSGDSGTVKGWIDHRYWIAGAAILVLMVGHTRYGARGEDYWEHCAVVKELATHPVCPVHPLLGVAERHAFYSPYALVVALTSRWSTLSAQDTLDAYGILNLVFLLLSLRCLIRRFFSGPLDATTFYALLFMLLLWPPRPWEFSGFLHLSGLGLVLPYPSTFAIACTLTTLALYAGLLASRSTMRLLLAGLLTAIVILTHPPTAVFLVCGLIALSSQAMAVGRFRPVLTSGLIMLALSAVLVLCWPYYSVMRLMTHGDPEFHSQSLPLYTTAVQKVWPLLLMTPFAAHGLRQRWRNNACDALLVLMGLLLGIYLVAYLRGLWGYGRTISYAAIVLQMVLGDGAARLERHLRRPFLLAWHAAVLALIGLALGHNDAAVMGRALSGLAGKKCHLYDDFRILEQNVGQYEAVLAPLPISWLVPAFSGKVIASQHPTHWIVDQEQRRSDLRLFFSRYATPLELKDIIRKYKADYVLLSPNRALTTSTYLRLGEGIAQNDSFLLIRCTPPHEQHPFR
jgi:hypothetical protein